MFCTNYRNHFKNVAPAQLGNFKEKVGNSTDFMPDGPFQRDEASDLVDAPDRLLPMRWRIRSPI